MTQQEIKIADKMLDSIEILTLDDQLQAILRYDCFIKACQARRSLESMDTPRCASESIEMHDTTKCASECKQQLIQK
jgi:hypothetical protein